MIQQLPIWIPFLFLVTYLATLLLFYVSNNKPKKLLLLILFWSGLHSVLAYFGFYQNTTTIPPRYAIVLLPVILMLIYGILPKQIDWVIKNRNIKLSTFLHTIRIPMEIVLFYLYCYKTIPKLMTFEGRNFDILAGITAILVGVLLLKNKINKKVLLLWNVVGLCLILFIFINAILSSELPFQQFGFEQPNRAVNYFPFILLPAVVVPIVIYTHLSDIIMLKKELRS